MTFAGFFSLREDSNADHGATRKKIEDRVLQLRVPGGLARKLQKVSTRSRLRA